MHNCDEQMALIKKEQIRHLLMKAAESDPQRYCLLHAQPASGMSGAGLFQLLELIQKGEERQ